MPRYECDQCGACCRHLIVEADVVDALREPRLIDAQVGGKRVSLDDLIADGGMGMCLILAAGQPCRLLDADNRCTIYPTRPTDCVAMQAGDDQCQDARRRDGLEPLQPLIPES